MKSIFTAVIPLINITGLGFVIDALISGFSIEDILKLIIIYLSINLSIALINQVLGLWENNAMRKASNLLQYAYMQDCLNVDYHYVQDGKILELKQKSMLSQPVFFLNKWGNCFNYIIQFTGVIFLFSILSPIFVGIIVVLSVLIIILNIITQRNDFTFHNEKIEADRNLDYLYDVMTGYKYAKEIRINNANEYIKKKYDILFKEQIKKLKYLLRKKLGISLLSEILSLSQTAIMYFYFTYQVSVGRIDIAQYTVLLGATTIFISVLLSFFQIWVI